jgi:hypothetical protein
MQTDEKETIRNPVEARQAVKGQGVRYVLTWGLVLALIAFVVLMIYVY